MAKDKNSPSRAALGLALVLTGVLLIFGRNSRLPNPSTTFENEPIKIEDLSDNLSDEEKLPQKIIIPKLSIDLAVRKAEVENGYWEVFEDSAGWGSGSGLPGETGNQVIFAHAREGLFSPLRSIKVGMIIYVMTYNDWYSYKVSEIKEVFPQQTEVIGSTEDETLTLYTCSGFSDSKRLIIVSKRV